MITLSRQSDSVALVSCLRCEVQNFADKETLEQIQEGKACIHCPMCHRMGTIAPFPAAIKEEPIMSAVYITDPGGEEPCTYPLETAPVEAFDAWLDHILAVETIQDTLFLFTIKAHRGDWDGVARWWCINALELHDVDVHRYFFKEEQ